MSKNYLLAIATLMGTIIGVGLFAIPFVINQSGIVPLIILMVGLAIAQCFLHLLFAEAVLSTKNKHRLPGLAGKYVGKKSKIFAFIVEVVDAYGSILAYIIIGGMFLHQLLGPSLGGSAFFYSTCIFALVSIITFFDIKLIAGTEFILMALLFIVVGLITWRSLGHIQLSNYHLVNWQNFFLPYGSILFAVTGAAAIPEVCRLLANERNKIRSAIVWGTFLAAALMLVFILVVVGISGAQTSPDTLAGLGAVLSDGVVTFSLIFGLLCIFTSYIVIAQATEEILEWDFKLNNKLAWFLAGFIPYLLYFIGWSNLTEVISLTGAVTGGLLGVILVVLVPKVKIKPEQPSAVNNRLNKPVVYFLIALFVLGMIYQVSSML